MSMKIQARLLDKFSSHMEESYLKTEDVFVLQNVPAEMTFKADRGFMEHESQKHEYLPCFHLIGKITEIRAAFPFNISSVYFSEADAKAMTKDIIYYPSPDELAHIIQTGKYFSKYFTIPQRLGENVYTLPCMIDMMVVPPPNPQAYEQNLLNNFVDLEDEEKVNLPIVYIGVLGTGVNRRRDRLLDYYGIDLEDGFSNFVLTAESSGYTDPPLLCYMQAPTVDVEAEHEVTAQYYITPEEEAQMIHSQKEERQRAEREAMNQVSIDAAVDFRQATPEDALIAKANRAISRRMEAKFGNSRVMSLAAKREYDKQQAQLQQAEAEKAEREAELAKEEPVNSDVVKDDGRKLTQPDVPQQKVEVQMDLNPDENGYIVFDRQGKKPDVQAEQVIANDRYENAQMVGSDVADAKAQAKVDEAHTQDVALDVAREQQSSAVQTREVEKAVETVVKQAPKVAEAVVAKAIPSDVKSVKDAAKAVEKKLTQPDMPEQRVDVKMDLNPESNDTVDKEKAAIEQKSGIEAVATKADAFDVEHLAGADVSDAKAQAKVDDARTRDAARDVAVGKHQDRREVSAAMREIADRYAKSRELLGQQKPDESEYI